MVLSYDKFWQKLISSHVDITDLRNEAGISMNVLERIEQNKVIPLEDMIKICKYLECEPNDIIDVIQMDESSDECEHKLSQSYIFDKRYNSLMDIDWNFEGSANDKFASIHPYPAKFINNIPKALIELIGCPNDTGILDPFCGCGTTLYEAQIHNFSSVGVDLNPIACMISSIRTRELSPSFDVAYEAICKDLRAKTIPEEKNEVDIPNVDHWFEPIAQNVIIAIIEEINKHSDEKLRDELRFCLSSIIVRISNQESDTRYAAIHKAVDTSEIISLFESTCKRLSEVKKEYQSGPTSQILNRDILEVTKKDIGMKIGLVITSPPYPNAYEYWLYHKYRMWWLGYDPIRVRNSEIGARPHYQKKNGQTEEDFRHQMDSVFDLFDDVVVEGGHICIVIGRSIIKRRCVNNASIIANLGIKHGYSFVANIVREISAKKKSFNPSYAGIKEENILIFRRI